jgi:hypothetical protein
MRLCYDTLGFDTASWKMAQGYRWFHGTDTLVPGNFTSLYPHTFSLHNSYTRLEHGQEHDRSVSHTMKVAEIPRL